MVRVGDANSVVKPSMEVVTVVALLRAQEGSGAEGGGMRRGISGRM